MIETPDPARLETLWNRPLEAWVCEACDWTFLVAPGAARLRCPHCYQAELNRMEGDLEPLPWLRPPELIEPFGFDANGAAQRALRFLQDIPFAPPDLNAQNLTTRMQRMVLPAWLVDAEVQAEWSAEMGYAYDVVSHQDQYNEIGGGWTSKRRNERRMRWEERIGRLKRTYSNISAPALEDQPQLDASLGEVTLAHTQPYQPEAIEQVFVRIPDRKPEDAWTSAEPRVQAAAQEECRQAAAADGVRSFRWKPEWASRNWTLLLSPVYSAYYLDDDGRPIPVWIQGRTGKTSGIRKASMKRAQRATWITLGVAGVLFLLSLLVMLLGAFFPPALPLGGIGLVAALFVALGSALPVGIAWQFNRGLEANRQTKP